MDVLKKLACALMACGVSTPVMAGSLVFGDKDRLGFGYSAGVDPTAGAALQGLNPGQVNWGTTTFSHSFPFSPEADDLAHTDQIHTVEGQTGFGDGYSGYVGRTQGGASFALDFGNLVPEGHQVDTLTLGIMADDFQNPSWGGVTAYKASLGSETMADLSNILSNLNQTGPVARFFSIGVSPSLADGHVLDLRIWQIGNGSDGWAIDFLTVGVTTSPVPVPVPLPAAAWGGTALLVGLCVARRQRRQN